MSRPIILGNSKTKLLWEMKQVRRFGNQISQEFLNGMKEKEREKECRSSEYGCWMPHPRTGIYYPKGCERVMDGIPEGAATFQQAYWFRNLEGVEHPSPRNSSSSDPIDNLFIDA